MGTSSIFNGRNDRNPLLPEDYNSTQDETYDEMYEVPDVLDEASAVLDSVKWKTVKSDMSKYIKSGGTYGSKKHIARQYVKAAGGHRSMSSQSYSGKKAGGNLGNLFRGIVTDGVKDTFKNFGIEYEGKSIEEIFSRLVDAIATDSNTKEDIVAKVATQAALSKIFDYVESNEMDIDCLNSMSIDLMYEAMKEYISSYIWITMMKDLGSRLEIHVINADDSYGMECEFKEMIMGIVDVEFNKLESIINNNISSTIADIYERCLGVMEGIL